MKNLTHQQYLTYCKSELAAVTPILARHGFMLDADQPHLKGERFLMHAVTTTSGKKLILGGHTKDGSKVIIKAARDRAGKKELQHEQTCRNVLHTLKFASEVFRTPSSVAWIEEAGFTIAVTAYIEQVSTFLDRPLPQQFDFALAAFKAQEGTHATTYAHRKLIQKVYDFRTADYYLKKFGQFTRDAISGLPTKTKLHKNLQQGASLLAANQKTIEQYNGFLTHTDFVPHNFRIDSNNHIYLLDHSSFTFGNKYEGWARFVNFMELYNPPLAVALVQYIKDNRITEEQLSLKLMRIYRLGEIIWYYFNKLDLCEGDLKTLNQTRVHFWSDILSCVVRDTHIPKSLIIEYKQTRDSLRSYEEKERQKDLH